MKDYWYPWAPTKFRQDTMHLSDEQELIYRRLIDFYMETGGAIPDNDQALANIARVSLEKFMPHAAVIRAFFVPGTGKATAKLQLKRCDGILADQAERKQSYAERGKKGGRKKDNENNAPKATAKLKASTIHIQYKEKKEEDTVIIPTIEDKTDRSVGAASPPPRDGQKKTIPEKTKIDMPCWLDGGAWSAYAEMRKKIRKPMTDEAARMAINKLDDLRSRGHDPTKVLMQSVFNSWQGLFEIKGQENGRKSNSEKNLESLREWVDSG